MRGGWCVLLYIFDNLRSIHGNLRKKIRVIQLSLMTQSRMATLPASNELFLIVVNRLKKVEGETERGLMCIALPYFVTWWRIYR